MPTLKIEFDNQEALNNFALWLCNSGEQKYWNNMEYVEEIQDGPITAIAFEYHEITNHSLSDDEEDKYGEWLKNNTIKTVCGRITK